MSGFPIAAALVAGLVHALEPDHMAAVTTFVARRPHPLRAMGFGIRWGIGHSGALLVCGAAVILLGVEPREPVVRFLEAGVGVMLVGLGIRTMRGAIAGDPAWVERLAATGAPVSAARGATEAPGLSGAEHVHATTWVGAAHGLAGTAGFLAIVPALLLATPWSAGGYLLAFGVGTVGAMGLYGLVAGLLFHRAGARAPRARGALRATAGLASAAIGAGWIAEALW